MDRKWASALCLAMATLIAGYLSVAVIKSNQEYKSSWCHEGLMEQVGTDAMLPGDKDRVNTFIQKTGIHLYVYSYEWTPYGTESAESPEDFVLQMYRMCSKLGFPFPDWDASQARPDNSIFMAYEQYHTNDGPIARVGGFINGPPVNLFILNLAFGAYAAVLNSRYDAEQGIYQAGYESESLNAFLDKIQFALNDGILKWSRTSSET